MFPVLGVRLINTQVVKLTARKQLFSKVIRRNYSEHRKDVYSKTSHRKTISERAMSPTSGMPFEFGAGAVAGGALLGLGALCFYGAGLSKDVGALEKSSIWPKYIKDRIRATYFYFGMSCAITAASALTAFRIPLVRHLATANSFMGLAVCFAAMIGSAAICQGIRYKKGFGAKQLAWMLHTGIMGAIIAPMCYLGGPLVIKAAWYTAAVVGGLSAIAVCAPSDRFIHMGGPLGMGLGVVFASSLGSMFLSPATALGAGVYSIAIYGGLLVFSGFLLYDTQRIIEQAEQYPPTPDLFGVPPYDPINASLSIYMDTLNIFIRILTILATSSRNK